MKIKYKYNVINKRGVEEEWTGMFDTYEDTVRWYNVHGVYFVNRGHNLVLKKVFPDTFYQRWVKRIKQIKKVIQNEDLIKRCDKILNDLKIELKTLKQE